MNKEQCVRLESILSKPTRYLFYIFQDKIKTIFYLKNLFLF